MSLRQFLRLSLVAPLFVFFFSIAGCGEDKPTGTQVPTTDQATEATKNMEEFMKNQGKGAPKK